MKDQKKSRNFQKDETNKRNTPIFENWFAFFIYVIIMNEVN